MEMKRQVVLPTGAGVLRRLQKISILFVLLLIVAILAIASPSFFTVNNLLLVIKQSSIIGVLAVGMTFVIMTGGIDISVGSVIALAGVCAAYFGSGDHYDLPLIIPFLVAVGVGAVVGLFNGLGISYGNIPTMIMTLCTMMIARGLALVITGGSPIFGLNEPFQRIANTFFFTMYDQQGNRTFMGIPSLALVLILVFAAGCVLLHCTTFGKHVFAIGGNEDAAAYSGLKTRRIKLMVYVLCGALAGLSGILMASRITSGNATVAEGYEMNAIASVVIGGVSLSGGRGNMYGTLVGALIMGVISNGLDILGVSSHYQKIVQGAIILIAVFIDIRTREKQ